MPKNLFGKQLVVESEPMPDWYSRKDITEYVRLKDARTFFEPGTQLIVTSPPDLAELGLDHEWDKLYELYSVVFARCIADLNNDGVFAVLISDRKWRRTVVRKHEEVCRIAEKLGLVLFAHKIVMKHDHVDLYHMGYSHLLCLRRPKSAGFNLHKDLRQDIVKPFPQLRGAPSFRYAAGFSPQLMNMLVNSFSKPHDLVVDPFCGIATLLRVALGNDRRARGYEINAKLKAFWKSL